MLGMKVNRCTAELSTLSIDYLFLNIPSKRAIVDNQVKHQIVINVAFFFPSPLGHIFKTPASLGPSFF